MTFDEWQAKLDELKEIIAERIEYSKNWENCRIKIKRTFLEIKWFSPKRDDMYDPDGKIMFKTTRIAPLNKANLWEEVKRQKAKLEQDKKHGLVDDGLD